MNSPNFYALRPVKFANSHVLHTEREMKLQNICNENTVNWDVTIFAENI